MTRSGIEYRFVGVDGKIHTMAPEPGWNYNPGMSTPLSATPASARLSHPRVFPASDTVESAVGKAAMASGIAMVDWRRVQTPFGLDDVIVRKQQVANTLTASKDHPEQHPNMIVPALAGPLEVWLREEKRLTITGRKQRIYRRLFIALLGEKPGEPGVVLIREGSNGALVWTFMSLPGDSGAGDWRQGFLPCRKEDNKEDNTE